MMEKKPNLTQETSKAGPGSGIRNVPKKSSDHHGAAAASAATTSRSVPSSSEGGARAKTRPPKKELSQSLNVTGGAADPLQLQLSKTNAGDSPDSGSLYSNDEIPSGYNSGEQYDTLSTGYMSGEAYELPDTRMDLREPTLDVIEESAGGTGAGGGGGGGAGGTGGGAMSDEEEAESDGVFMIGPPPPVMANSAITGVHVNAGQLSLKGSIKEGVATDHLVDCGSSSTSDQDQMDILERGQEEGPAFLQGHSSPHAMPLKSKLRKKTTTFAIPIEASPLTVIAPTAYEESSDAAVVESAIGGKVYRAVPSDTDTSAIDSDANAIMTETGTDSGNERGTLIKQGGKKSRRKERRRLEEHDDAWFMAHDNKYWSVTRFICFWGSILAMLGATLAAAVLIFIMPRNCDPQVEWYHGTVTLDIHLDSLPFDSAANLGAKLDDFHHMGIQTLHLRNLSGNVPTAHIVTGTQGKAERIRDLAAGLHSKNMTLMVGLPVLALPEDKGYPKGEVSLDLGHQVENAIKFFMEAGADGIFLDGLEHFGADNYVADAVMNWKKVVDRFGVTNRSRIMMTSYKFAHKLEQHNNERGKEALKAISLLDATFNLEPIQSGESNFTIVTDALASVAAWDSIDERPWINWNLKSVPLTNAARALQMLLPGTININYPVDDADADLAGSRTSGGGGGGLANMTSLRAVAVPIFMNGNYKPCHVCQDDTIKETNYHLHQPIEYIVQLERFYSRRHRYVLVANFGDEETNLAEIGRIYSGGQLVLDTSNQMEINTDVFFNAISLSSGQAIVIKLPK